MEDSTVLETQEVEEVNATEETSEDVEAEETEELVDDAETDELEDSGESEDEADEDTEEVELMQFDFAGNKMEIPKGSMPEELAIKVQEFGKSMESAHTKRSQAVAEQVKSLEAREEAIGKIQALHGESLETYSKGRAVRHELEQLNQIDINQLWQSNPDQARQVSDKIAAKEAEFNSLTGKLNQQEQATAQFTSQETARRYEEGKVAINSRVPDFETKHAKDVVEYAISKGVPKEHAETWPLNPFAAETAYKAMMFDRLQTKAKKQTKITPVTAKPVKSVSKGKGGGGIKDPAKMSMGEYAKWRGSGGKGK